MIVGGANQSSWNFSEEDRKVLPVLHLSTCMPLFTMLHLAFLHLLNVTVGPSLASITL